MEHCDRTGKIFFTEAEQALLGVSGSLTPEEAGAVYGKLSSYIEGQRDTRAQLVEGCAAGTLDNAQQQHLTRQEQLIGTVHALGNMVYAEDLAWLNAVNTLGDIPAWGVE
jgi:hypothetical protein